MTDQEKCLQLIETIKAEAKELGIDLDQPMRRTVMPPKNYISWGPTRAAFDGSTYGDAVQGDHTNAL